MSTNGGTIADLNVRITENFAQVNSSLSSLHGSIGTLGASLKNALNFTAVTLGLTGIVASIKEVVGIGVKYNANLEQTKIAYDRLFGADSKKMLQDITNLAEATPFEFPELADAAGRLKAFGFQAKAIPSILIAAGDASSALGKGSEGMNRVVTALSQVQAKGKLSAEEMNQLAEVGVNGFKYIADSMGISEGAARKMAEKGLIPVNDALKALVLGMEKDFGGMMDKQSRTAIGLWSTLKDNINSTLGELTLGLMVKASPAMTILIDKLKLFREGFKVGGLAQAIYNIVPPELFIKFVRIYDAIKGIYEVAKPVIIGFVEGFRKGIETIAGFFVWLGDKAKQIFASMGFEMDTTSLKEFGIKIGELTVALLALNMVLGPISTAFKYIGMILLPIIGVFAGFIAGLNGAGRAIRNMTQLEALIPSAATGFARLWERLTTTVRVFAGNFGAVLSQIAPKFYAFSLVVIGGITRMGVALLNFGKTLWAAFIGPIGIAIAVGAILTTGIIKLMEVFKEWRGVIITTGTVLGGVLAIFFPLYGAVVILSTAIASMAVDFHKLKDAGASTSEALWLSFKDLGVNVANCFVGIANSIGSFFNDMANTARDSIYRLKSALPDSETLETGIFARNNQNKYKPFEKMTTYTEDYIKSKNTRPYSLEELTGKTTPSSIPGLEEILKKYSIDTNFKMPPLDTTGFDPKALEDGFNKVTSGAEDATTAVKKLEDALKGVVDEIKSASDGMVTFGSMFDKVSYDKFSPAKLAARAKKFFEEISKWSSALNTLTGMGVDQNLVNSIRGMGLQGSGIAQGLARASKEQIDQYASMYTQSRQIAVREQANKLQIEHFGSIKVLGVNNAGQLTAVTDLLAKDINAKSSSYTSQPSVANMFK